MKEGEMRKNRNREGEEDKWITELVKKMEERRQQERRR